VCAADNSFYQMLTAEDNLKFFTHLYGPVPGDRVARIIAGLSLDNIMKTKFNHLSSGMRQRLALARAMLVSPEILLVDEVSRSLDEDSAAKVSTYIKNYASESNASCLVVTHDKSWAKIYSSRSGTLKGGRIEITQ
jgi:ABC-type multidrug transport system ATPase subunit